MSVCLSIIYLNIYLSIIYLLIITYHASISNILQLWSQEHFKLLKTIDDLKVVDYLDCIRLYFLYWKLKQRNLKQAHIPLGNYHHTSLEIPLYLHERIRVNIFVIPWIDWRVLGLPQGCLDHTLIIANLYVFHFSSPKPIPVGLSTWPCHPNCSC